MNRTVRQSEISIPATGVVWKRLSECSPQDLSEWRDLAERALEPNVFLDPGFALSALDMTGGQTGAMLVYERGRLTGLFPGEVESIAAGRAVSTFVGWTHPFAPLGTPLVDRDSAAAAIDSFFRFLPSIPGTPRVALLPMVNEAGAFARIMSDALLLGNRPLRRFGAHERAVLTPDDALALSGGKLKELRRQRRRLEERGTLAHETVREPAAVKRALEEYLVLESKGWKGRGGSAAQSDPAVEKFMVRAVGALGAREQARIDFLRLNGSAIAAAITLFSDRRGWFWKISYEEEYARFSPGVQLTLDLTGSLRKGKQIALVDSCATAQHPMIDRLWRRRLPFADWLIPLSGQASFAAGILFESARRISLNTLKAARGLVR